jgi:hypothetical protein
MAFDDEGRDKLIAPMGPLPTMGFLQELAGRVEEAASAGGKFADAFVRTAGATFAGALVFVEKEIGYAQRAVKRRKTEGGSDRRPSREEE